MGQVRVLAKLGHVHSWRGLKIKLKTNYFFPHFGSELKEKKLDFLIPKSHFFFMAV